MDQPLDVQAVDGDVVVTSNAASVALSLTPRSAMATGQRLIDQGIRAMGQQARGRAE